MAAPDPFGISIEELPGGGWSVLACCFDPFDTGIRTHRIGRASRILMNLRRDRWSCWWCSEPVPEFRRGDARYCCEGCRKRAARQRRHAKQVPSFPTR